MPFGMKKKEQEGDFAAQKSSLFGSRSKTPKAATPTSPSANPYAVAPPPNDSYTAKPSINPYANAPKNDPYAAKGNTSIYSSQAPTSSFGSLTLNSEASVAPPSYGRAPSLVTRNDKSAVPAGGYGGGAPRYQGGYGQPSGYGSSDPYGNGAPQHSRHGPSGYGGLERSNSQDTMTTDAGRNALFGDAAQRAAEQPPQDTSYTSNNGYGADQSGGYGENPDRQVTEEEQEEEDVVAAKTEIKYIKQQDVASTRNARRIAEQAEQTGRETLARLGAQGERIHNTEKNLDMASNQNRLAEEKARELKTLNRSMFAVHVANPFTAKRREEAANAIALDKHQRERGQADATRSAAYSSKARQQGQERDINGNVIRNPNASNRNYADRAKYQFEADSEDDEMENEIDDNLNAIGRGVHTLHQLGKAMGEEIDSQNRHIDRITKKTDTVDDQIALNRARLDRISKRG